MRCSAAGRRLRARCALTPGRGVRGLQEMQGALAQFLAREGGGRPGAEGSEAAKDEVVGGPGTQAPPPPPPPPRSY